MKNKGKTTATVGDVDTWKAEVIRLTLFPQTDAKFSITGLWERIVGIPPDSVISRPREATQRDEGVIDENVTFIISTAPGRLDFVYAPTGPQDSAITEPPSIGTLRNASNRFKEFVEIVIRDIPQCIRVAVGAVVLEGTKSREDGYKRLQQFLPAVTIDPARSRDFHYQINRPRESSAVPGLLINRLNKWSCGYIRGLALHVMGGEPNSVREVLEPEFHVVRAEFDVSTAAERRDPFAEEQIGPLIAELIEQAETLALLGDMPTT